MKWLVPALAVPLLLGVAGCGDSERTKAAVLRVLRADRELAETRWALPPNATPSQVAWAADEYCNDLERLDMSDCPTDFQVAYRQHIRAWRETADAFEQLPDGFLEGFFMGAVNGVLRKETDGGLSRLEGGVKRGLERVRDTWEHVEEIGAKYDAAL